MSRIKKQSEHIENGVSRNLLHSLGIIRIGDIISIPVILLIAAAIAIAVVAIIIPGPAESAELLSEVDLVVDDVFSVVPGVGVAAVNGAVGAEETVFSEVRVAEDVCESVHILDGLFDNPEVEFVGVNTVTVASPSVDVRVDVGVVEPLVEVSGNVALVEGDLVQVLVEVPVANDNVVFMDVAKVLGARGSVAAGGFFPGEMVAAANPVHDAVDMTDTVVTSVMTKVV